MRASRLRAAMAASGTPTPDLATAAAELQRALVAFQDALRASPLPRAPAGPVFEALRRWRTEEARARQVPPYVIATDAVLRAIEDARPNDLPALRAVRGMGGAKADQYGERILAVVQGGAT